MQKPSADETSEVRDQEVLVLCDLALTMTAAQREAFLASACADNPQRRVAVEKLLQAVNDSGSFLKLGDDE